MKKEIQHIIKIEIVVHGRVTQPDIIGAIFGQTEDTLGEELSLRKLQKEGNIGRIDLDIRYDNSVTKGIIEVPSYMDLLNTVMVGASLETITKIGPCTASARILHVESIKEMKVKEIKEHAKRVLEKFISGSVDSQELVNEVIDGLRESQIELYGEDRLVCGPRITQFDEVILVEAEDELKSLLRNNIKNVVVFGSLSKRQSLKDICSRAFTILFVNRGREHLIREISSFADIDSVTKPDPPKRIVDLHSKEIHKVLRAAIALEQVLERKPRPNEGQQRESSQNGAESYNRRNENPRENQVQRDSQAPRENQVHRESQAPRESQVHRDVQGSPRPRPSGGEHERRPSLRTYDLRHDDKSKLEVIKSATGPTEVSILDRNFSLLGKVPIPELKNTLLQLRDKVYAAVTNGPVTSEIIDSFDESRALYLAAPGFEKQSRRTRLVLLSA